MEIIAVFGALFLLCAQSTADILNGDVETVIAGGLLDSFIQAGARLGDIKDKESLAKLVQLVIELNPHGSVSTPPTTDVIEGLIEDLIVKAGATQKSTFNGYTISQDGKDPVYCFSAKAACSGKPKPPVKPPVKPPTSTDPKVSCDLTQASCFVANTNILVDLIGKIKLAMSAGKLNSLLQAKNIFIPPVGKILDK